MTLSFLLGLKTVYSFLTWIAWSNWLTVDECWQKLMSKHLMSTLKFNICNETSRTKPWISFESVAAKNWVIFPGFVFLFLYSWSTGIFLLPRLIPWLSIKRHAIPFMSKHLSIYIYREYHFFFVGLCFKYCVFLSHVIWYFCSFCIYRIERNMTTKNSKQETNLWPCFPLRCPSWQVSNLLSRF